MLQDILRTQVQLELSTARKKIGAIANEIEACACLVLAFAHLSLTFAVDTNALARQRSSPPTTRRAHLQRDDSLRKGRDISTGLSYIPSRSQ